MNCEVENWGVLGSKKGCNFFGIVVDFFVVFIKDKEDLKFGVVKGVSVGERFKEGKGRSI